MSEEQIVQEPVVTPEPPKKVVLKYQPRDPNNGQPLGNEQVIEYDGTPEDLAAKMAAKEGHLVALNRKLNKQVRLSSNYQETIPDNAPRFDPSKYELRPEPLTAEERIQIAQDMQDPEKLDFVADRLVRSKIGDPDVLRTRLSRVEQRLDRSNVHEEALAFRRSRPDYFPTKDNLETLAAWIDKNNLDPIKENFELAYDTLKDYLEQKSAVAPAPVVETLVTVQPTPVTTPAPRPVSTGLTRSNASDSGPVTPNLGITRQELDKMSGDEYKRKLLHEKGFREKVEALDRAEMERRAARQ